MTRIIGRMNFVVPCHKFPPDDSYDDLQGMRHLGLVFSLALLLIETFSRECAINIGAFSQSTL